MSSLPSPRPGASATWSWGTHRANVAYRPKGALQQHVQIINLGSAMPKYYCGEYTQGAPNALSYSAFELETCDGKIQGYQFIPMRELYQRHGQKAA